VGRRINSQGMRDALPPPPFGRRPLPYARRRWRAGGHGRGSSFRLPRRHRAIAVRSLVGGLVAPHGLMELKPRGDAGFVEVRARAPSTRARALCLRDTGMDGQSRFGVAAPRTVVARAGSPGAHPGRTEPSEKQARRERQGRMCSKASFSTADHVRPCVSSEQASPRDIIPWRSRSWARQSVRVVRIRQAARGSSVASGVVASSRLWREIRGTVSRPSRNA
jgi:hypothetical protein